MSRPPVYDDLPGALFALVPELDAVRLDPEPRADCGRCVRVAEHYGGDPHKPWAFDPALQCCTFSPTLPNVLVGRALRRGGSGADRVAARIAERRDMTPWGLFAGKAWDEAYAANLHRFGRAPELVCPFRSTEALGCGIWPDRPPVCRTWHCKHTRGDDGLRQWTRIRALLDRALDHFAIACVAAGRPPVDADPTPAWEAWFRWCADWVDDQAPGLVDLLRDAPLEAAARDAVSGAGLPEEVPDVVIPSVTDWDDDGDGIYLVGYSRYDGVRAPKGVFAFLSRLDGEVPWRRALALANATLAEPLTEAFVADLFRVGLVRSPLASDRPDSPVAPVP